MRIPIPSLFTALLFMSFAVSCSKHPNSNSEPGNPAATTKIDSIVYELFPEYQFSSRRKITLTFSFENNRHITNLRDSIFQFNGVKYETLTDLYYDYAPGYNRLNSLQSISKIKMVESPDAANPNPYEHNVKDNYQILIGAINELSPSILKGIYFNDPTRPNEFTTDDATKAAISSGTTPGGLPAGSWYEVTNPPSTASYFIPEDISDSIKTLFYGQYFREWMNYFSPLGNWKPYRFNTEIYHYDVGGRISDLTATNSAIYSDPPSYVRRLHFSYDPRDSVISAIFPKDYYKNMLYLKLFSYGMPSVGPTGDFLFSGIDYIQDLKWLASSSTDSIFYTARGSLELKGTESISTKFEMDSQNRVEKIKKFNDYTLDQEVFTFFYKK